MKYVLLAVGAVVVVAVARPFGSVLEFAVSAVIGLALFGAGCAIDALLKRAGP